MTRAWFVPGWMDLVLLLIPIPLALATVAWILPGKHDATGPRVVSVAEVRGWEVAPLWVDARSAASYERATIPGALNLTEGRWSEQLPTVLSQWRPERKVVVFCSDEGCRASETVAGRLSGMGIAPVYILEGGWEAWQEQ